MFDDTSLISENHDDNSNGYDENNNFQIIV